MPRSTGKFIAYDLRPAKQSERRILIDILKIAGDSGLPINDYRYVGMGANRFYDFLLIHRYLGLTNMVSLEHDEEFYERARFNVPFKFIEVRQQTAGEFAATDTASIPTIYWLDYDGGISPQIVQDIFGFAERAIRGDFVFVTVSGNPPRTIDRVSDAERLVWLQDNIREFAGTVTLEDVERANFASAVHKILIAAFRNAFAAHADNRFLPCLQVEYADTMRMVTVGGALLPDAQASIFQNKIAKALPFLEAALPAMYDIRSLNLTEKERALLDLAVTSKRARSVEANKLRALGFREIDLKTYKELLRYLPRYVETIV